MRRGILKRLVAPAIGAMHNQMILVEQCVRLSVLAGRRAAGIRLSPHEREHLQLLRELHRGDSTGHRGHVRFTTRIPAVVELGERHIRGSVLNLSAGGMFIASETCPPVGSVVRVRVGFVQGERYLVGGTVCHCRRFAGERGFGVRLLR